MISVVFIEPESPGNVGFLARTMKNFGLKKLILINPCELGEEAQYHAMHAQDILENSKTYKSLPEFIKKEEVDFLVGTTGTPGGSYNVPRIAITPENLSESIDHNKRVGIVLGREGDGLTNHELEICDVVVTIPTHDEYPIMNISHAGAVIFYELFKKVKEYPVEEINEASREEREDIIEYLDEIIGILDYPTHKHRNAVIVFRRLMGRAFISGRESHTLKGVFRKIRDRMLNKK